MTVNKPGAGLQGPQGFQGTQGASGAGGSFPTMLLDGQGAVADSTTDNAVLINSSLVSLGPGFAFLSQHLSGVYAVKHPIIVPNGVALKGMGAMQGGTTLVAHSTFPHTTTSGSQTTPSDTTTTFSLTVAATAGFPLATGGITPPNGVGVLCVAGITIFYTGATGTTFTGCRVGPSDVSVTIADARAVGTFMVWLCDPGLASGGFGTRIDDLALDCNSIPGIGGIHSCHIQEGGGWSNIRARFFANFGIRIDTYPGASGSGQAVNYEGRKGWIIFSSTAEPEAVGIDIMQSYTATSSAKLDSQRSISDHTIVVQGNTAVVGKAGVRLNGATGRYTDFHMENQNAGVLVGDVYPCYVEVANIGSGNNWGSGTNAGIVVIGNTAGNAAKVSRIFKAATTTGRKTIVDLINGYSAADQTLDYEVTTTGAFRVNGGTLTGTAAQRPDSALYSGVYYATDTGHGSLSAGSAGGWVLLNVTAGIKLAQDSVAAGARDNSSASTLTVTFTKATTAGNLATLSATQSGNFVLSSIVDSRGNTWQVDKTQSGQGPTSNIASCLIGTNHQIGDTLTLTFTGSSTYASGIVQEWSGIASSSWPDQTGGQGASVGTTPTTLATPTRTQADELLYGVIAYTSATVPGAGSNFVALTAKTSGAGNHQVVPVYRVVSRVGTDPATWNTSVGGYDAAIVTYKAAAATI